MYKRDLVNGTKLHKRIKNPFCPEIVEVVKPVFDRLGDANFHAGCEKSLTQNPNESPRHLGTRAKRAVHLSQGNKFGSWSRLSFIQ